MKQIPAYFLAVAILMSALITYFVTKATTENVITPSNTDTDVSSCNNFDLIRLKGYKYVDPLLFAERDCEATTLKPLEQEISAYIDNQKQSGKLVSASVYIRTLDDGEWTDVNPDEQYHPASLLKLPVLFTFARMAETKPEILNEKVLFKQHDSSLPKQMFPSKSLEPGHTYTIRELLQYLIAYSDNDALYLLYNYHNPDVYKKVFADLNVPMPNTDRDDAGITVKEYSTFLKVLYNGTYLSLASSEFALSYLAESDFKNGVVKGLPANTTVAHKFGEYFKGNYCELHESAIVYLGGKKDFLITIMTKGTDMKVLSDVLGNISNITYNFVSKP